MSYQYDVIVIGSGGAGLVAALTAADLHASVLLISKAPLGLNNCTTYAGGGFSYAGPGGNQAEHRAKTLEIGRGINDQSLLTTFSEEGPEAVAKLRQFGVKLEEYPSGGNVGRATPIPGVGGLGMTLPLVEELAKRDNIHTLVNHMVVKLLHDHEHCYGVMSIDLQTGKCEAITAKAVIIATGGGGRIYSRTNNPHGTTGDGYHLLAELGLEFRDMEFVQFYPLGLAESDLPLWFMDLGLIDIAPLTDNAGQEFLKEALLSWGLKSGREGNLYARDRSSITILQKWQQGDAAYLHLEQMSKEDWQHPYYKTLLRLNRPQKFDFTKQPARVKPLQHYMSGGVIIDTHGQTAFPGVFACGEVTGGVDGANRIGGNALTNITLFGQKAAQAAIAYVNSLTKEPGAIDLSVNDLNSWQQNINGSNPRALRQRLQQIMDNNVAPLREAKGLQEALSVLNDIGTKIATLSLDHDASSLREALELRSLHTTACLVTRAALLREESRGVHFRNDFPAENPEWQKTIILKAE